MKPYLLDPFSNAVLLGDPPVMYDGNQAVRMEDVLFPRVSLKDLLIEYETPLREKVKVEQAKWDGWIGEILQVACQPTLLSQAGVPVEVEVNMPEFTFPDPTVRNALGAGDDPYALDFDAVSFRISFRMDFKVAMSAATKTLWSASDGPWWAESHQPVWTVPGG